MSEYIKSKNFYYFFVFALLAVFLVFVVFGAAFFTAFDLAAKT
jgi:hypothetical protein